MHFRPVAAAFAFVLSFAGAISHAHAASDRFRAEAGQNTTVPIGETVTLDGSRSIALSNKALEFEWEVIERPSGSSAILIEPDRPRPQFSPDVAGDYVISLTLGKGSKRSVDTVRISTENVQPEAEAGAGRLFELGETILLDGSGSTDFDGDRLSYRWDVLSAPAGSQATLSDTTSVRPTFVPDRSGTYELGLQVSDDGLTWSEMDAVTLGETGPFQPGIEIVPAIPMTDGEILLDAGSTVTGGEALSHVWSVTYGETELGDAVDGRISISPATGEDVIVQLILKNEDGHEAFATALIGTGNAPPVAVIERSGSGLEPTLDGSVSWDADGDALSYEWSILGAPAGASVEIVDPTAPLSDMLVSLEGTYVVQLAVTDEAGSVSITATAIDTGNEQPTVSAGLPQTMAPGESISLDGHVQGDVIELRWDIASVEGIEPSAISFGDRGSASTTLSLAEAALSDRHKNTKGRGHSSHGNGLGLGHGPATCGDHNHGNGQGNGHTKGKGKGHSKGRGNGHSHSDVACEGYFVLELTAKTADGDIQVDTVTISLSDSRPVADAGQDVTASLAAPVTIDGTASYDPDGSDLTYRWSVLHAPEGSSVELSSAQREAAAFTAAPDIAGLYVFQLIVSDGTLRSVADTVLVDARNTSPVVVVTADTYEAFVGETVVFDASGSYDPDGDTLTYAWNIVSAPDGSTAAFENAAAAMPGFTPDSKGVYLFEVRVDDGTVQSDPAQVQLTVPNRDPVAAISSPTGDPVTGSTLTFDGSASTDPDGDTLSYSWVLNSAPTGSGAVLDGSMSAQASFVADLAGSYEAALSISDGEGTSTATRIVSVTASNTPPSISPIADTEIALGTTLRVEVGATDAEGDTLSYSIQPIPLPVGASFDANAGILVWRPVEAGVLSFTIGVSDGTETVYEDVTVTVAAPDEEGPTLLSGLVIDPETGTSVPGATVAVGGVSVTTDGDGRFTLDLGDTSGTVSVSVSGPEGSYGASGFATSLIGGVDNILGQIDAIPLGEGTTLSETDDTPVSDPNGVTVTIAPGSASDPSGDPYTGEVAVVDLPPENAGTLDDTGFEACRMSTVQPVGITFDPPAQVSVPNEDGLEPGTQAVLWAFSDTLSRYLKVGLGEVNAPATTIETVSGGLRTATGFVFVPLGLEAQPSEDQAENFYIPSLLGEGNATATIEPPSYTSYGESRRTSLIYNSATAAPRPIVSLDLTIPAVAGIPNLFQTELKVGGKVVSEQVFTKPESATGAALQEDLDEIIRQAVQFDGSDFETGSYEYTLTVISRYDCSSTGASYTGSVLINNKSDSPYGAGWWPQDLARIIPQPGGSVVLDEGDGTLKSFGRQAEPLVYKPDPTILDYAWPTLIFDDFDGDGDIDPLVHEWMLSQSSVEFNNGDETFTKGMTDQIGEERPDPGPDAGSIFPDVLTFVSGDLNDDGLSDVVYTAQYSDNLYAAFNDGQGSFDIRIVEPNFDASIAALGDFNGDNIVDIAAGKTRTYFFLGNGDGTFTRQSQSYYHFNPNWMEAVDVDLDGDDELAVVNRPYGTIHVFDLDGRIQRLTTSFSMPRNVNRALHVADLDKDGRDDLVIVNDEVVAFIPNAGNGLFGTPVYYDHPEDFVSTVLAASALLDADGDGDLDVYAVPRPGQGTLYLRRNRGDGTFGEIERTPFDVQDVRGISFADLNADGSGDLVLARSRAVEIYFSDAARSKDFASVAGDFTTLVELDDGGYLRTFPNGAYQQFDASGFLVEAADSTNRVTSWQYDGDGRVLQRTDPGGKVAEYSYGADGKLAALTVPGERTTNMQYDAAGNVVAVVHPDQTTQRFGYDENSRITFETDRRGNTSGYSYASTGAISGATLPDGRSMQIDIARDIGLDQYGGSLGTPDNPVTYVRPEDRITYLFDENGLPYRSTVNEFGALVGVRDMSGRVISYTRDDDNRVTEYVRDYGEAVYGIENPDERAEITVPPSGGRLDYFFREMKAVFGVQSAHAQGIAQCRFDEFGREAKYGRFRYGDPYIEEKTEAAGTPLERTTSYEYTIHYRSAANGDLIGSRLLLSMTDALGQTESYEYDDNGNLLSITDVLNRTAYYEHNREGLLLTYTDFGGRITRFAYDAAGNLVGVTNADGVVTQIGRDASGMPVLLVEAVGSDVERRTSYAYDDNNFVIRVTDATGSVYQYAYDSHGNLTFQRQPDQLETSSKFNNRDWPTEMTSPSRGTSTYDYETKPITFTPLQDGWAPVEMELYGETHTDSEGRESTLDWLPRFLLGPEVSDGCNATRYVVVGGYTIETVDALGHKRVETFDGDDRRRSVTDARGNETLFLYDRLDRLVERVNPNGEKWQFEHDALDRRTATIDPKGQRIEFTYDAAGRLLSQTAGDDTRTFSYDINDNLLTASDKVSAYAMTYDVLDRLTEITASGPSQPDSVLSYTYDALDRRASVTDQNGASQSYEFDAEDRLLILDSDATGRFRMSYDVNGRRTVALAPNTVRLEATYDAPTGRLDSLSYTVGAAAIEQIGYTYDAGGDFSEIESLAKRKIYTFDDLERLTATEVNADPAETYSYDEEGNRTGSSEITDDANRLLEDADYTYGYDTNGNLVSRTAKADGAQTLFSYDVWDRLVGVTLPDGGAVSYAYDVFGRRISKTVPDALGPKTVRYVYDGPDIFAETDGADTLLARYTHGQGADEPLALERYGADATAGAGTRYYYHTDHLGSVVALTTASGALAETFDYDSYGRRLSGGAVDQPYGFTAREYDAETGLYYYRARHFDPATGRFLQEDPLGFAAGDFNLYRYTWNDPLHWTDPSGMAAIGYGVAVGRALAGAGAIAGVAEGIKCALGIVASALANANGSSLAGSGMCALQGAANVALGRVPGARSLLGGGRGSRGTSGNPKTADGPPAGSGNGSGGSGGNGISVDEALDKAGNFLKDGVKTKIVENSSGVQFIQTFTENGNNIVKRVGFDINPSSSHVKKLGPHLNLQTQINGAIIKKGNLADPHISIDPSSIRSGDY